VISLASTRFVLEINQRVSGAKDDQEWAGDAATKQRRRLRQARPTGTSGASPARDGKTTESRHRLYAVGGPDMRGMFYSTLSQVVELGIFAAAAAALAVGMLHLR
jgi:hypothetical protein